MPKQSIYTVITPLPAHITRQNVLSFLHEHTTMIDLNPLVESRRVMVRPPAKATPDEYAHAMWYEIVDRISFLPRNLYTGKVVYHVCFHNLPNGLQTHCHAPMGLDIRERWSVGGFEPGEIRTNQELGLGIPKDGGLYLREDVDMRVNTLLTAFVRKNLDTAHKTLVDRLVEKAAREETARYNVRLMSVSAGTSMADAEKLSVTSGSTHDNVAAPSTYSESWPLPNDTSSFHGLTPTTAPRISTPTRQHPAQLQQGYFTASTSPITLDRHSPPLPSKSPSRIISINATGPQYLVGRSSNEIARVVALPDMTRSSSQNSIRIRRLGAAAVSQDAAVAPTPKSSSRSTTPIPNLSAESSQKASQPQANTSAARAAVPPSPSVSSNPPSTNTSTASVATATTTPLGGSLDMGDASPTLGTLPFPESAKPHESITPATRNEQAPITRAQLQNKPTPWDVGNADKMWVRAKEIGLAVGGVEVGGMATVWEDRERERDRLSAQVPSPEAVKAMLAERERERERERQQAAL